MIVLFIYLINLTIIVFNNLQFIILFNDTLYLPNWLIILGEQSILIQIFWFRLVFFLKRYTSDCELVFAKIFWSLITFHGNKEWYYLFIQIVLILEKQMKVIDSDSLRMEQNIRNGQFYCQLVETCAQKLWKMFDNHRLNFDTFIKRLLAFIKTMLKNTSEVYFKCYIFL